jgi:hypothetical protein
MVKKALSLLIIFSLFASCINPFMEEILSRGKDRNLPGVDTGTLGEPGEEGPEDLFSNVPEGLYLNENFDEPVDFSEYSGNNIIEQAIAYVKGNAPAGVYTLVVEEEIVELAPQSISTDNFDLTIRGAGGEKTIQHSAAESPLFNISAANAKLTLGNNITLNGANGSGSLVSVNNGTLVIQTGSKITGVHLKDNMVYGGGVSVNGGVFTMEGGAISGNTAAIGGVYVDSGTFTMIGGEISDNTSTATSGSGGGVSVSANGTFIMLGGKIIGNNADAYGDTGLGGGVWLANGSTFTMSGGEISGNRATRSGGGVYVSANAVFTMLDGKISDNTTIDRDGGGVYVANDGTFNMNGGEISSNTCGQNGGGVSVYGASAAFNMNGGTIGGTGSKGNTINGSGSGGGVYVELGKFTMSGGSVSGNTASSGGGVYLYDNSTFTMTGGEVSENKAANNGGGVFLAGGNVSTFNMSGNASVFGNTANNGGGVYMINGFFAMEGGAVVAANNDVYLSEYVQITVTDALTGTEPVATITPASYDEGTQVVALGENANGTTLEQASAKFAVKPNGNVTDWSVDSEGKLVRP